MAKGGRGTQQEDVDIQNYDGPPKESKGGHSIKYTNEANHSSRHKNAIPDHLVHRVCRHWHLARTFELKNNDNKENTQ